jgi:hypothetical protein
MHEMHKVQAGHSGFRIARRLQRCSHDTCPAALILTILN